MCFTVENLSATAIRVFETFRVARETYGNVHSLTEKRHVKFLGFSRTCNVLTNVVIFFIAQWKNPLYFFVAFSLRSNYKHGCCKKGNKWDKNLIVEDLRFYLVFDSFEHHRNGAGNCAIVFWEAFGKVIKFAIKSMNKVRFLPSLAGVTSIQ